MSMFSRLFSAIYNRINHDPQAVSVYTIFAETVDPTQVIVGYDTVPVEQVAGYTTLEETPVKGTLSSYPYSFLTIEGGVLYLYNVPGAWMSDLTALTFDLSEYKISDLSSLFAPYFIVTESTGYTSVSDKSALTLLPVREIPLLSVTTGSYTGTSVLLQAFTANTWRHLAPIAFALGKAYTDTTDGLTSLNPMSARGFWVDFWAWFAGLSRFANESDSALISRILVELTNPKVNNIAMEQYLTTYFGNDTAFIVNDTSPGWFEVLADPATAIPLGTQVQNVVNEIKGAGIQWLMNYQANFTEGYEGWFGQRYGKDFSTSDTMEATSSMAFDEENYRYPSTLGSAQGGVFTLGGGSVGAMGMGMFNLAALGEISRMHDDFTAEFTISEGEVFPAILDAFIGMAVTMHLTEQTKGLYTEAVANSTSFGLTENASTQTLVRDSLGTFQMGAIAYSEGYNFKDGSSSFIGFGTCGGNLVSTLNDSPLRSGQKEGLVMYYNNRQSYTIF